MTLRLVIDLRDATRLGLTIDDLAEDRDWSVPHDPAVTQELGLAAHEQGVEGLIVPSASLIDNNLVILVDNLQPTSEIEIVSWIDPKLYVDRT